MDITYTIFFGLQIILEIFMFSVVTRHDSVIHNFATSFAKVISHYVIGRAEPSTVYLRINDVRKLFSPCE
jgi:hypothetical protein